MITAYAYEVLGDDAERLYTLLVEQAQLDDDAAEWIDLIDVADLRGDA